MAAAVVAAPYAYALAVLRSRYDVGFESSRLRTTAGRSVPEEALHALTPGGTLGAVVLLAVALVGLASLVRLRPGPEIALALWLAIPILFFTLVPASTRFFGRYLAPAEPAFYVLVAAGLLTIAGRRLVVATALAAGVVALSVSERIDRLRTIHDLGLRGLVAAVDAEDRPLLLDRHARVRPAARPARRLRRPREDQTSAGSRSCPGSTYASSRTSSGAAGRTSPRSSQEAGEAAGSGSSGGRSGA